jgi:hypothetical protein
MWSGCTLALRQLVKAMLNHQYVYAAISPQDGKLDSLVLSDAFSELI